MPARLGFAFPFLLPFSVRLMADVTGRWTAGGTEVFMLRQVGDAVTGVIQGRPGEPAYKIVEGTVRGNRIFFFVLHEDERVLWPGYCHAECFSNNLDLILECGCLLLLELAWTSTSFADQRNSRTGAERNE